MQPQRVVVMGQGYVGLPVSMRAVQVGHHVVGYEPDLGRLDRLRAGLSYVEDVPDAELAAAIASGRYLPTSDPADLALFDVAVISVPTPLRDGAPDLSYVEAAALVVGAHLRSGSCVILESTTYPGTTEDFLVPILEDVSGLKAGPDFLVGYSPERIDPGNSTWGFVNTPKIVAGLDARSLQAVQGFYDTIVDTTVPVPGLREAELTKLLENTFRHVNIALVNELAMFAHELSIDIWSVINAAATKPFGYLKFTPGPGVGGHCLPIDPSYLSWQVRRSLGQQFKFVELANDVNEHMPDYVVRRVMLGLNERRRAVSGSRVLLLGLAYKANTGDARESPAVMVARRLAALGAQVRACDPHVDESFDMGCVMRVELSDQEIDAADVVVILTDHAAFDFERVAKSARYVFDTRHVVNGDMVEAL